MNLMADYARTRLDVTTPPVRTAINSVFGISREIDTILDGGSHGTPPEKTVQSILFLNNHISNSQEELLTVCERAIGPQWRARIVFRFAYRVKRLGRFRTKNP